MLAFIRRLLRPRPVMLSARILGDEKHVPWWQSGSVPAVLTVLSLGERDAERQRILTDCAEMVRTIHLRMQLAEDRRLQLEEELAQASVDRRRTCIAERSLKEAQMELKQLRGKLEMVEDRVGGIRTRPVLVSRND